MSFISIREPATPSIARVGMVTALTPMPHPGRAPWIFSENILAR